MLKITQATVTVEAPAGEWQALVRQRDCPAWLRRKVANRTGLVPPGFTEDDLWAFTFSVGQSRILKAHATRHGLWETAVALDHL